MPSKMLTPTSSSSNKRRNINIITNKEKTCCKKQPFNKYLRYMLDINTKSKSIKLFYVFYLIMTIAICHFIVKYNIMYFILVYAMQYMLSIDIITILSMTFNGLILIGIVDEFRMIMSIIWCDCKDNYNDTYRKRRHEEEEEEEYNEEEYNEKEYNEEEYNEADYNEEEDDDYALDREVHISPRTYRLRRRSRHI